MLFDTCGVCYTNLHICLRSPASEYLPSPPGSAAEPPAVYWAGCSLHRPAVAHHRKGQQRSRDVIFNKHRNYLAQCH